MRRRNRDASSAVYVGVRSKGGLLQTISRFGPVLCLLASLGCGVDKGDPADTAAPDTDVETDTDTDTDSDTDTDADTDITDPYGDDSGVFYYVADFTTDGGEFASASFGYGMYDLRDAEWSCVIQGSLQYEGPAPSGCPDCDWAFDLGPVERSVAVGPDCDGFFEDGYLDGSNDFAWGFSDVYYYEYEGTPLRLESVVHLLYEGVWIQFAFNYGPQTWVTGDAGELSVERPITDGYGYP